MLVIMNIFVQCLAPLNFCAESEEHENPKTAVFWSPLEARGFAENGGVRCWSEVLGVRWRRRVGATGRSAALAMDLRRGERVFRRGRSHK